MANNFPGNVAYYCASDKWSNVTVKATSTAYTVNNIRRENAPAVGNERCFVAITAGTSSGTAPTMILTRGAKTTDGGMIWMECTGVAALNGDMTNTPNWTTVKNQAISLGHVIQSNDGTKILIVTTAGTTGNGAEPAWTNTVGGTTADNTVTWTTLQISSNHFAQWAAPHRAIGIATKLLGTTDPATFVYVGSSHSYVVAAPTQFTNGQLNTPINVICIDYTNTPPATGDVTTGAIEGDTGGTYIINLQNQPWYIQGVTFKQTGGTNISFQVDTNGGIGIMENCQIWLANSNAGSAIQVTGTGPLVWNNTTLKFSAAGQQLNGNTTPNLLWLDTLSAIDSSGTAPTTLIAYGSFTALSARGVDLSFISGTIVNGGGTGSGNNNLLFEGCKLNSAVTTVGAALGVQGNTIRFMRCASSNFRGAFEKWNGNGKVVANTTVYRNGGCIVSGQNLSWAFTTNSACGTANPFTAVPIQLANTTTSANVTVTLYGLYNAAAVPTNAQVFFDCEYMGSSASPQLYGLSSRVANLVATPANLTADAASDWTQGLTARANSHAYSVGNTISVPDNTGRCFFCTVAGTSASSEPAGYATAIDGGSVTDGGATFRAGCRFSMAVTLSNPQPQLTGPLLAVVSVGAASVSGIYVDPFINLM